VCCFSAGAYNHVQLRVGWTRIFARPMHGMKQALVYQMALAADAAVAMILPIPIAVGAAEDSVQFVSLEGHSNFFDDLQRCFPAPAAPQGFLAMGAMPFSRAAQTLAVHKVGKFEASFVPSPKDFSRLDERFRMPPGVLDKLPQYRDWGFAVFQLKDFEPESDGVFARMMRGLGSKKKKKRERETKQETIHPMAFTFPRRDLSTVFFPTMHVHDGAVHESAHFDHTLYVQHEGDLSSQGWHAGLAPSQVGVDTTKSKGLVEPFEKMQSRGLHGDRKNEDTWIRVEPSIDAAA
jgi:hypothetical protein